MTKSDKHPGGRPPKLTPEEIETLVIAFEKYIEETEIPIVAEFAHMNGLSKQYLYNRDEFIYLIKRATTKKEAALERECLKSNINTSMAIFSLKQLGWSDKSEVKDTTDRKLSDQMKKAQERVKKAKKQEDKGKLLSFQQNTGV